MAQYVYTMNRVSKVVPPKRQILKNISLSFFPGAKIGVLGLNGAGKSTLLRIMAGVDKEFDGEARPQPDLNVGYLPQEPELDPGKTVREVVEEALGEIKEAQTKLDAVYAAYAEPDADFDALAAEQAKLENIIQAADAHNLERKLEVAADALRLPEWDANVANLSGGERRRVALCRLLLSSPEMLLLDEPTNHLDAESVAWLERFLVEYPGTVVAITHDRYFLDNAAGWILELDRGEGIPYQGNYSAWLEQKEARWSRNRNNRTPVVRQWSTNWNGFAPMLKVVSPSLRRVWPASKRCSPRTFSPVMKPTKSIFHLVHVLAIKFWSSVNVSKGFGDRLLIEDLSFSIPKGAIVGIIGGNGAGKSTLFKMIVGQEQPDSGSIEQGDTVKISNVQQLRDELDDTKTVWEAISDGQDILRINNYEVPSRAYIGRFNFKGGDQQKRVGELSGGERGRLQLAATLKHGGNVLLLDEPSNDLDVETLRALEEAMLAFPGCAMVISHDRWFLDRIATHILAYEGDSKVTFFEGNYTEYEAERKERLGEEAAGPHRIKYKRIDA